MHTLSVSSVLVAASAALGILALSGAEAGEVHVGVAANFTNAATDIAAAFAEKTGDTAVLSFGASGSLYAQITQAAPFEIFLSADAARPAQAETDGLAVAGSRFTYAIGQLVLWSPDDGLVDDQGAVLRDGSFAHIAVANAKGAPYGAAAVETIAALGLTDALADKVVTGENITQTFQFVQSGNAELGFVARSQIGGEGGSQWLVPAELYTPILQDAVLLETGADNETAKAFIDFLKGPEAAEIIHGYGYGLTTD